MKYDRPTIEVARRAESCLLKRQGLYASSGGPVLVENNSRACVRVFLSMDIYMDMERKGKQVSPGIYF